MGHYQLSPKKKQRNGTAILVFLIILGLLIGISTWFFTKKSTGNFEVSTSLMALVAEPTSSINAVHKEASECTNESRDEFVIKATQINEIFEDNYALALATSRIALSPIVSEMQSATRELKGLSTDLCGKVVQEKLSSAYEKAIDVLLAFMKQEGTGAETYILNYDLQEAFQFLVVYEKDISYPFLLRDHATWQQAVNDKAPIPTEVVYFQGFSDKTTRCDDFQVFQQLFMNSYYVSVKHFNNDLPVESTDKDITPEPTQQICDGYRWLDTPTPTSTPIPSDTPIPTNTTVPTITRTPTNTPTITPVPRSHKIEFYIEGSETLAYSVEYAENSAGKKSASNVLNTWTHSFVEMSGAKLLFYVITPSTEEIFSCVITVDGQVFIRKTKGEGERAVKCQATVP